ncbi:MAG: cupin domain-containing protein [Thermoleophilia bacterium]|nr:cupin domain-containing protein [Thermoleophilia bacterium]
MDYVFSHLSELGEGPGFRKVRAAMDIEAFGVNAIVLPAHGEAFWHYHDTQDELYFVHAGTARFEVADEDDTVTAIRELGPGGLFHAQAAVHRRMSNAGEEELVVLVVGASGGYIGRDGQLVNHEADIERRQKMDTTPQD